MSKKSNYENKDYARAPYNFIPFPDKIFYRHVISKKYEDENMGIISILPKHNSFKQNFKTGYIEYSIEVKSPLFISDGNGDFFKINGKCTIPGSTVRGKVRSNCETLSHSYPEFIGEKKLWYRGAFSNDVLKEIYKNQVLSGEKGRINEKVNGGYLTKKGSKWYIHPAEKHNNKSFAIVHESNLRKNFKKMNEKNIDKKIRNSIFMYNYNVDGRSLWDTFYNKKSEKKKISKEIDEKKNKLTKNEIKSLKERISKIQREIEKLLKNNQIKGFRPYYCRVKYELRDNSLLVIKDVVKLTKDNEYGFLMNSTRLNHKQNHYLIYRKDISKIRKPISKELINQYKTSVKYRHNEVVENFELNDDINFKNDEEKPIFYITDEEDNIISFGFTPYLKIPYERSVKDGIKTREENIEQVKQGKVDYSKGIFGFTNIKINNETKSYKGRVSFTNAKPLKNCEQIEKPILKQLMNPKISSFQLYLKQDANISKELKTYSSDDFELRGEKFYWLRNKHDNIDDYETHMKEYEDKNNKRKEKPKKDQYAILHPIDKGEIFKGRIYFENLYEDELGLLIMSIKPFKEAKENLGQGKPYGFGKVNFEIEDIIEIDPKERFMNISPELSEKSIMENRDEFIEKFKNYMKKQNIDVDLDNEFMYKCFKYSKINEEKITDRKFNYMEIKHFKKREILKPIENYMNEFDKENAKEVAVDKDIENGDFELMAKKLATKFKTKRTNKK